MEVTLRVVGIFYNKTVKVKKGATVKDVMDAAVNAITTGDTFNYTAINKNGKESPSEFRAFYEAGFTRGKGASVRNYSRGTYRLSEDLEGGVGSYTVWQYYIRDKKEVVKNYKSEFIPYDDKKDAVVKDGDTVTWRLVTIRKDSEESTTRRNTAYIA